MQSGLRQVADNLLEILIRWCIDFKISVAIKFEFITDLFFNVIALINYLKGNKTDKSIKSPQK